MVNNESTLLDFLSLVEVVNFREAMTERSDDYEIAFVEGSITRDDEVLRLKQIRKNAKILVALGSCACFGGVNQLKNRLKNLNWVKKQVYGKHPIESGLVRALEEVVTVDLRIYGCPIKKEEVEKIVLHIALGKSVVIPKFPVCMECKANENICLFDLGEPCLGPITRAGCDSWCPNNKAGCWGCRGPAEDANVAYLKKIMKEKGFSEDTIIERLDCFGGFAHFSESNKQRTQRKKKS
ncbi:MAG: NADH:ubiquinone oxidoreductase [Nitrospiraceae bacterium]|nr:MAG: NADH:ubiquinone oxidoreductase [Nitrospiraceae bacterium]